MLTYFSLNAYRGPKDLEGKKKYPPPPPENVEKRASFRARAC